MRSSRRKFLKSGALAVAGAAMIPRQVWASSSQNVVLGIQLYSIREAMSKDPASTLEELAKMGYKTVEHANYVRGKFYGYEPKEFKKLLSDLGLTMPTGHTVLRKEHWDAQKKDFTDEWKKLVEDAAYMGQKYVISPSLEQSLRETRSDLIAYMDIFNQCGELCQEYGMKFGYHNHDFEFYTKLDGEVMYDIILDHTDPNLVTQQMDIGNMYGAGGRALEILGRYPNRFELLHVKDEIKSETGPMSGYESTVLGKGVIPVKEILDAFKDKGGTIYYVVEQEAYQGKDPLDCMRENYEQMKAWGYS